MKKIIALITVFTFALSGCGGNEIEGRNFVSVLGMDEQNAGGYDITLGFITPDGEDMYTAQAKSIESPTAAVTDKLLSSGKRQMYFGHLKAIIVGKDALTRPENLREILSMASSDSDISMDTVILSSEKKASETVLAVSGSGDGLYIWDFYKNNKNRLYSSQKLTLADAVKKCDTQNGLVIPLIEADDKNIEIHGGIICTDYIYSGKFDVDEMQGFIYLSEDGKGSNEVISINSTNVPFEIKRDISGIKFYESGDRLSADIDISLQAECIDNFRFDKEYAEQITNVLEGQVSQKVVSAVNKLQELNSDAIGLSHRIMRGNYRLYEKYSSDNMFKDMDININVKVDLK